MRPAAKKFKNAIPQTPPISKSLTTRFAHPLPQLTNSIHHHPTSKTTSTNCTFHLYQLPTNPHCLTRLNCRFALWSNFCGGDSDDELRPKRTQRPKNRATGACPRSPPMSVVLSPGQSPPSRAAEALDRRCTFSQLRQRNVSPPRNNPPQKRKSKRGNGVPNAFGLIKGHSSPCSTIHPLSPLFLFSFLFC